MTVPPLRLDPAYPDRDAVWRNLVDHAPYPLMAAGAGYGEMMKGAPVEPWFRTSWAAGGKTCDAAIETLLDEQRFIEAAGRLFDAQVVRAQSLTVNVMGPMDTGARHFDVPTYRGLPAAKTPIWLPMMMGVSGLFDQWAVRVAGVLTWFYEGTDGEYEYWPYGIEHHRRVSAARSETSRLSATTTSCSIKSAPSAMLKNSGTTSNSPCSPRSAQPMMGGKSPMGLRFPQP
jgi:hypothetical protein